MDTQMSTQTRNDAKTTERTDPPKKKGAPAKSKVAGRNEESAVDQTPKMEFVKTIGESFEEFEQRVSNWRWHIIDGVMLPVTLRENDCHLAAVNIVQTKLLSKFPQNIPLNIAEDHVMLSHKMTAEEAMALNIINSTHSTYDLGCQIFTADDELVDITQVETFYWIVKKIHLANLASSYKNALRDVNAHRVATACLEQLSVEVEGEISRIDAEIREREESVNSISKKPAATTTLPNSP